MGLNNRLAGLVTAGVTAVSAFSASADGLPPSDEIPEALLNEGVDTRALEVVPCSESGPVEVEREIDTRAFSAAGAPEHCPYDMIHRDPGRYRVIDLLSRPDPN